MLTRRRGVAWGRVKSLLAKFERSSPLGMHIRRVCRNTQQVQRQFEKRDRKKAKAPAAA